MRYRFNPPPGWPAVPPDWSPPAGWEPDPGWPPAPAEWPFWVPEYDLPLAPARPKRRYLTTVNITILAAAALAVSIVATVVVRDAPAPYPAAAWARAANTACERGFPAILTSVAELLPTATAMAISAGALAPGTGWPDAARIGARATRLSGEIRGLVADLRAIPEPPDGVPAAVTRMTAAMLDVAGGFDRLAQALARVAAGDPGALAEVLAQGTWINQTGLPAWYAAGNLTPLAQCGGVAPAPS